METTFHTAKLVNGEAMFGLDTFTSIETALRGSSIDYGVVPTPKWDEAQEGYYSFMNPAAAIIPVTNEDLDFTGMILEALCHETYETVMPAYYITAMQDKYMNSPDDQEMVGIITASRRARSRECGISADHSRRCGRP